MKKIETSQKEIGPTEELVKIPVSPGDVVFVKFEKAHKPLIQVFSEVVPC